VERKKKESDNISREYFITGAWDWYIGGNLSGYVIVNGIGSSGTLSGYDTKGELLNSGHWKYDRKKYLFEWQTGAWVDNYLYGSSIFRFRYTDKMLYYEKNMIKN
jgi:hypothetical protein